MLQFGLYSSTSFLPYMDLFVDLLQVTLPAAIVAYALFLVVRSFLNREFQTRVAQLKESTREQTLPLRLQAYERMAIFLERITPNQLIVRCNDGSFNAAQLQQIMLHSIREEFEHNLSQQIYISPAAWQQIANAKEAVIALINTAAQTVDAEANGLELAKAIFEEVIETGDRTAGALLALKQEAQELF